MPKLKKKNATLKSVGNDYLKTLLTLPDFKQGIAPIIAPIVYFWFLFSRIMVGIFEPLSAETNKFTSFNRVFGHASLFLMDAQKRANSMKIYNLVIIALCFVAAFIIVYFLTKRTKYNEKSEYYDNTLSLINSISILGMASIAIAAIIQFNAQVPLTFAIQTTFVMLSSTLIYQRFHFISFDNFKWGLFSGFAITFFLNFMFRTSEIENQFISENRFGILFSIILVVLYTLLCRPKRIDFQRLKTAMIPMFFGMLCLAMFLEFTNILNQHSIFIVERESWARVIYGCIPLVCVALFFSRLKYKYDWENICYLGIIVGIAAFTQLPPLSIGATTEICEQANHGMLTYDFFRYGRIPLLESFDGHMLSISFGGLVYGLLNGQGELGIDSSYFFYSFANVFSGVIIYYLLKNFFSKEFSLLAVLIIPFTYGVAPHLVVVSALIYCIKKDTVLGYVLYFIAITFTAVYELPPAIAIGVGSFIALLLALAPEAIREKKLTDSLMKLIKAIGIFAGFIGSLYLLLCLIKGINPISRLLEIYGLIHSMNNWNYLELGDTTKFAFNIGYFFLPAIVTAGLIYTFVKLKFEIKNNYAAVAIVSMFAAHFMNYTRMLGRHNFAEGVLGLATQFVVLPLALMFVVFAPKYKKWGFVSVSMLLPMLVTFSINLEVNFVDSTINFTSRNLGVNFGDSIINSAIRVYNSEGIYFQGSTEKVARVNYDSLMQTLSAFINMMDAVVPTDETFMDLSSCTIIYALTNREKPVYVNQSPYHLSGEYTQTAFIRQIENYGDECNFALLGFGVPSTDLIRYEYKYYMVYEYLNENFVPLCRSVEGFELWVRPQYYDEAYKRLWQNMVYVECTAELSKLNDDNWTNGVLNSNGTVVLFQNSPLLQFADSISLSDGQQINIVHSTNEGIYQHATFDDADIAQIVANAEALTFIAPTFLPSELVARIPHSVYNLHYLPYLWGTYDDKKAFENPVVLNLDIAGALPIEYQSTSNYVMIRLTSDGDGKTASLNFTTAEGAAVITYTFLTIVGENTYLVRPSSDTAWGTGIVSQFSITQEDGIGFNGAWLLMGD